jgi:hypothetical protein
MLPFKPIFKSFIAVSLLSLNLEANEGKSVVEASVESTEYSGKQDDSWVHLQSELTAVKTKMDAQQAIVTELLVSQKNNKGRIAKDQVDQLSQNYKKLQELIKEYNEKLQAFENRHPEKGQTLGRQYSRKKAQTLDQMESSLTLDGRIRKINKKIRSQFGVEDKTELLEKKVLQTHTEKNSKSTDKMTAPPKPKDDVTEKIIIVK